MTAIKPCNCVHTYQDTRYGEHNRVCNSYGKDRIKGFRCSVCNREHLA